jgi:hypothetical protein
MPITSDHERVSEMPSRPLTAFLNLQEGDYTFAVYENTGLATSILIVALRVCHRSP